MKNLHLNTAAKTQRPFDSNRYSWRPLMTLASVCTLGVNNLITPPPPHFTNDKQSSQNIRGICEYTVPAPARYPMRAVFVVIFSAVTLNFLPLLLFALRINRCLGDAI